MSPILKAIVFLAFCVLVGCNSAGGTKPTQHVAKDPKAAEINMRLGLNYLQRGDYAIALEKLEKSLKQNPNLPSAHNTIALLYQRLGETEKAEHHFHQATARAPDYSQAQNNYGVFLCEQGKYLEGEQRFLKAVENPLYKSKAQAYENMGLCVNRIPDDEKAEKYFRRALQIEPTLRKSLAQMATLSYDQGEYLQARAYVQRFQAQGRWTAKTLLTGIKTENKLGDKDAVASYTLILRSRFPDSDEMQQVNRGLID